MPPLVWLALFAAAVILAAWWFPGLSYAFPGRTVLAAALMTAGVGIALAGVLRFRRHRTTVDPRAPDAASALVTDGVFARTRNPMYVGMATVLTGLAAWTGNVLALTLVPSFVIALTKFQIEPEEVAMRRLFGEAWEGYAARVPRWVGR